jgi:hypothetical protein
MKALFLRNFSSIHVHYVPLQGYGDLGTADIFFQQNARLSEQIQKDAERVQKAREKAWMKFDSVQFSIVVDHAFKHLAQNNNVPFNFSTCRRHTDLPNTIEVDLIRFFEYYLSDMAVEDFRFIAAILGSCFVRRTLEAESMGKLV